MIKVSSADNEIGSSDWDNIVNSTATSLGFLI